MTSLKAKGYKRKYMNIPKGTFTEHYDAEGIPIYVGDIVVEGCNGLKAEVVFDKEKGALWLKGLGEGYGIENSHIEWDVVESEYSNTHKKLSCNEPEL